MIHLKSNHSSTGYIKLACTSNPFTKGRIVNQEQFFQAWEAGQRVCKKCLRIAEERAHVNGGVEY